jgi:hypothetical protein
MFVVCRQSTAYVGFLVSLETFESERLPQGKSVMLQLDVECNFP